jgi:citrate lyase subunit beta/citryl-CoA lyase
VSAHKKDRRALRSGLTTPGHRLDMIEKARKSAADSVIIDLEDAVPLSEKVAARTAVIQALDWDWSQQAVGVRINDLKSSLGLDDVLALSGSAASKIDFIVLPKAETAEEVRLLHTLILRAEARSRWPTELDIHLLIESPLGLLRASEMASASRRVRTLVYGPGDFALGMTGVDYLGPLNPDLPHAGAALGDPRPDSDTASPELHTSARFLVALAARAAGICAMDGPFGDHKNLAGCVREGRSSRQLGFTGKWCIHPDQVEGINSIFPSASAARPSTEKD